MLSALNQWWGRPCEQRIAGEKHSFLSHTETLSNGRILLAWRLSLSPSSLLLAPSGFFFRFRTDFNFIID
jgi:hypothetical protein